MLKLMDFSMCEWATAHQTGLLYLAAFVIAAVIGFWNPRS
jgi:hypothetical protein